ncbi:MAG: shikimate kinase [Acidobacteriota bacterium]
MKKDGRETWLKPLAERVRRLRQERGWTVKEAAARSDLSPRFFAQLEAGEANIALSRLARVAGAFGMQPVELIDEATPSPTRRSIERMLRGRSEEELRDCLAALEDLVGDGARRGVALLGLRGAGKSRLGQALGRRLGLPFVELDDRIEARAGMTLTEIFSLHGEAHYRRLTQETLDSLVREGQECVVALPGGIVHDDQAWSSVRRRFTTAWLRAEPEDHWERVLGQGDRRPMAGREDAMGELRELLARREPLYRRADLTIDTSGRREDESLLQLLDALAPEGWSVTASR